MHTLVPTLFSLSKTKANHHTFSNKKTLVPSLQSFGPEIHTDPPPTASAPSLPMLEPSFLSPLPPMAPPETRDCSQGFCSIYCPHWCYIVFPPPPPLDDDADTSGAPTFSPLVIAIIGILASAFVLVSYYAIISKFCGGSLCRRQRQHRDHGNSGRQPRHDEEWHVPLTVGLDRASIDKITIWKYKRGDGSSSVDCSVCLGEFQEDESLRLLPKCGHAFHVQCIDTWLKSHSNCPLCRANIVLVAPGTPQLPAPPPLPATSRSEGGRRDEMAVAMAGSEEGTGLGNQRGQRMRRSFSTDSFRQSRVQVADILRVNIEDDPSETADHDIAVGGSSPRRIGGENSKGLSRSRLRRSVSSGRLRHSVLPV